MLQQSYSCLFTQNRASTYLEDTSYNSWIKDQHLGHRFEAEVHKVLSSRVCFWNEAKLIITLLRNDFNRGELGGSGDVNEPYQLYRRLVSRKPTVSSLPQPADLCTGGSRGGGGGVMCSEVQFVSPFIFLFSVLLSLHQHRGRWHFAVC